jgi:hypothetical protein
MRENQEVVPGDYLGGLPGLVPVDIGLASYDHCRVKTGQIASSNQRDFPMASQTQWAFWGQVNGNRA